MDFKNVFDTAAHFRRRPICKDFPQRGSSGLSQAFQLQRRAPPHGEPATIQIFDQAVQAVRIGGRDGTKPVLEKGYGLRGPGHKGGNRLMSFDRIVGRKVSPQGFEFPSRG
jgi:hypothetical protein